MSKNQNEKSVLTGETIPQSIELFPEEKLPFFEKVFFFLIPCLGLFEIKIVGRLFISEIILALCLPFLLMRKWQMLRASIPKTIIILGGLWLFSQVITDIVRATPFEDYSRGWAKITVLLMNFMVLYIFLYQKRKRIVYFVLGLASYQILAFYFKPGQTIIDQWWKFGLGVPLTVLVILLCQTRFIVRKPLLPTFLMIMMSVLSISLGSRGLGGIIFLTGVYYFIDNIVVTSPFAIKHLSLGNKILIALSIIVFFYGFQFLYQNVLSKAAPDIIKKEQSQRSGDYGLLLGGRTEIISSYYAIRDSPILGHGSWAKDPKYDQMMYYFLSDAGYKPGRDISELIPTHSHFFSGWVEAGILGAVFWGFIYILVVRVLLKLYKVNEPIKHIAVFIGFSLLWDILFSPFGAERRMFQSFNFVVMLTVLDNIIAQIKFMKKPTHNAH